MNKKLFSAAISTLFIATSAMAAENMVAGAVNFTTCMTDSRHGKKEQENMKVPYLG